MKLAQIDNLQEQSFERHGPGEPVQPLSELFARWTDLRERCSLQLQAIADSHASLYIHALQSNQYDAGSKPMRMEEELQAIERTCVYCESIEHGDSLLRQRGTALRTRGAISSTRPTSSRTSRRRCTSTPAAM